MQSFYTSPTSTHISHGPAVDELRTKYSSTIKPSARSHTHKIQRPGPIRRAIDRVRLEYYRYEVTFGLYVMTPSEKLVTNTFVIVVLTLLLWALLLYFPSLLYQKLSRLVWLLTGTSGEEVGAAWEILGKYGNPISPASTAENSMSL
ncbi:hypothetical protein N7474_007858 [Penicillium riverlandense]|uniref:uncharacterized protein n=1 Tax=Penicillium riverlandense TaxID=1903569 RepID=UPI0025467DAF|nr:uncharacterized protein N7474_007858 [Penicillium riverlandense]KAJ5811557.1 hypothetical protein N7474_007858 [Penicillium riverlandense]